MSHHHTRLQCGAGITSSYQYLRVFSATYARPWNELSGKSIFSRALGGIVNLVTNRQICGLHKKEIA